MKIQKNITLLRLEVLAKVACLALLLGACRNDDPKNSPGESVLVKFSVSPAELSGSQARAGGADGLISSVCILQFYANGTDYGNLCWVAQAKSGTTSTHYTAALMQSVNANDNFKLVVLANLPSYGFLYGMEGSSYDAVQKACLSASDLKPLTFYAHLFPMFGVLEGGKPIQVKKNTVFSGIELLRAVARVDIGFGTKDPGSNSWNKGSIPFNMEDIQVFNKNSRYTYLPETRNYHFDDKGSILMDAPSIGTNIQISNITYNSAYINGNTYCAGYIYLPETLIWPDPNGAVYDSRHTNRLALIVGGYYKGSTKKTYYRVDFSKENPRKLLNILRNKVYQFTITEVTDAGYDTAVEAYTSKPVGLSFTFSIDGWKPGVTAKPEAREGYLMVYGGQNGSVTTSAAPYSFHVKKKSAYWEGQNSSIPSVVDYNTFYGEVSGNLRRSTAYPNGDIYVIDGATDHNTSSSLLSVEGAYPFLMVAPGDAFDAMGSPTVHWRDGAVLTAFDLCRSYSGLGYSDWRLPRASELLLMRLNRTDLEKQKGFSAFTGIYWSGSECDAQSTVASAASAMSVDFDPQGTKPADYLFYAREKSSALKVRCVRQVYAGDF